MHTYTHTHTYLHQTENKKKNNKSVFFKTILLYYRKSSGFEYTSFKEVHSAWRFGVLRLETQRAGGGMVSLLHDTGLLRCLKMYTSTPHRQRQRPQPQSLACCFFVFFFDISIFLQKRLEKKGCIKNTLHSFILFRQAKH